MGDDESWFGFGLSGHGVLPPVLGVSLFRNIA
jgi:hypothetical protein